MLVAIVTGGAGGIGLATSLRIAADIQVGAVEAAARTIEAADGTAHFVKLGAEFVIDGDYTAG